METEYGVHSRQAGVSLCWVMECRESGYGQGQSLQYKILLKSLLHSQGLLLKRTTSWQLFELALTNVFSQEVYSAGQTIPCAIDNVHNTVALWKQTTLTVNESYKGHNNLDLVTERRLFSCRCVRWNSSGCSGGGEGLWLLSAVLLIRSQRQASHEPVFACVCPSERCWIPHMPDRDTDSG